MVSYSCSRFVLFLTTLNFAIANPKTLVRGQGGLVHLSDMHRLVADLLVNYDPSVMPSKNTDTEIKIYHLLILNSIVQLDSKGEKLKVSVYETWEWQDFYLSWDPSLYSNISTTALMRHNLWLPDLVILNEVQSGATQQGNTKSNIIPANVNNSGWVKIETPSMVEVICEINISDFPFDTQVCELIVGSWSQGVNKLHLLSKTAKIDLTHYVEDAEWMLMDTKITSTNTSYKVHSLSFTFSRLHYQMVLRRRMAFYSWNIVVPAILVNTMSILVFLLPPENGEKVSLGITILLALSVNMMVIRDYVPANSLQTPVLSTYTLVCMIATTLTLILSLPTVHVKSMGNRVGAGPTKNVLSFCLVASKWFCINQSSERRIKHISLNLEYQQRLLQRLLVEDSSMNTFETSNRRFKNDKNVNNYHRESFTLFCNEPGINSDLRHESLPRQTDRQFLNGRFETNTYLKSSFQTSDNLENICCKQRRHSMFQHQPSEGTPKHQTIKDEDDVISTLEKLLRMFLIRKQHVKIAKLTSQSAYLKWICVVMLFDRVLAITYGLINLGYLIYFAPYYISRSERWF